MVPTMTFDRRTFLAGSLAALGAASRLNAAVPPPGKTKKGCCLLHRNQPAWRERVEKLGPAWVYTWGSDRPAETPAGVDFTPMLWGNIADHNLETKLSKLKAHVDSGEIKHLLTFNEPDQKEQSNMTVERVVELWPRLMELGVPLISPGCVHPDREWMNAFMEQVEQKNLRVDAIAMHSYGGPGVEHLVNRVSKVSQTFGRPVWITEFAVGDWEATSPAENRHSPARIAAFMRELLPALEDLKCLERYAWFSALTTNGPLGTSALLDSEGQLTALGEIYAEHRSRVAAS